MPNIIPIRKLKDTGRLSGYVQETNEPVFVTKNGYGCMVIMNIEVFEKLVGKETYSINSKEEKPVYVNEEANKCNK